MQLPVLYHKTKLGKIEEWKVWTVGPEIHVEWGLQNGAKQTTHTAATTKNAGKKNEVKPEQQAEIEAKAMWKHRLDRKYSETVEGAAETVFLPMLAHKWDAIRKKVKYPVYLQPKFDGNRALAYWEGDELKLMSRQGKDWPIEHIKKAVAKILPKNMVLDGEIYKHGVPLQEINELIKKFRPGPEGTESLQFYAYDCFDPEAEVPWADRKQDLEEVLEESEGKTLVHVDCICVDTEEAVYNMSNTYVQDGYEGGIVRLPEGIYELGYRSRSLLKVKNFQDDEFEITGHYVGKGLHEGCIGFECKTKEGKPFRCYPRGKMAARRAWGENVTQWYGKKLTVRFQKLTNDGIPFHPIGICVRDERDLPNDE